MEYSLTVGNGGIFYYFTNGFKNNYMVNIYSLNCPYTMEIKYIGKTTQKLNRRLSGHITESVLYNKKYDKCKWIRKLVSENQKPKIVLLEKCTLDKWEEAERFYIKKYWNQILNYREGGAIGNSNSLTKRHKEKISKALIGKPRSIETKQKISKGHLGKKLSNETKEKIRQINLGKKQSYKCKDKKRKHKGIVQMDLNNNIVGVHFSLSEAQNKTGFLKGNISSACTGRLKTYKGFKWKYKK